MAGLLDRQDIEHLLSTGRTYRSARTVRAVQLTNNAEWVTQRGDRLIARRGDWQVTDGADIWTVSADVFLRTYTRVQADVFRKTAVVKAVAINEVFAVQTLEGIATGHPGDWLVCNPGGDCWPVAAAIFAERYVEA